MAALHSALQTLSPISFESVPTTHLEAKEYLKDVFSKARLIIDSVPPPPADLSLARARSRAETSASDASASSEVSASSVRSDPLDPANIALQKEWGKPIKLAAKDNPLGMAVYKAAGKDGQGAWFARRSVHEGMGFTKWKMGLQKEFPESMEVQGAPGEGNIRGIGGERRVERVAVDGAGMIEVYHLSAQFPGPTAPRDFVTLLITSSSALGDPDFVEGSPLPSSAKSFPSDPAPRHFMVISKPCLHPQCPPRDGFIRGQYESVEFIREIPLRPQKTLSSTQLLEHRRARASSSSPDRRDSLSRVRDASRKRLEDKTQLAELQDDEGSGPPLHRHLSGRSRKRGRTISYAESRGTLAKGEAVDMRPDQSDAITELNPVEWVMVTRSDPGGSVPRFLVERGTPSGIVSDAGKFINWAFTNDSLDLQDQVELTPDAVTNDEGPKQAQELEANHTNSHLAGMDGASDIAHELNSHGTTVSYLESQEVKLNQPSGLLSSVANLAHSGVELYAPQLVIDRLPDKWSKSSTGGNVRIQSDIQSSNLVLPTEDLDEASSSSSSSVVSFASAEERFEDTLSVESTPSVLKSSNTTDATDISPQEKELRKLNDRKRILDERLARSREKELKDKEEMTSRDEDRLRKAEEKHAREKEKQELKYKKEVAKLEAKRIKDALREEERKKKAEEKDEKVRLVREKEELKQKLEVVCLERDLLKEQVGALQRENTTLVAKMGKMGDGQHLLKDIRTELSGGAPRSTSGSLRKGKLPSSALAMEAPVIERERAGTPT